MCILTPSGKQELCNIHFKPQHPGLSVMEQVCVPLPHSLTPLPPGDMHPYGVNLLLV